jgi:hypothetical protein
MANDFKNRYLVSYRKAGNDEFSWFTKTTDVSNLSLDDVSPGQTYEIKVKTLCEFTNSEDSDPIFITTPAPAADNEFKCGVSFISADTCQNPLRTLSKNGVFNSNGTSIHVSEVSGNNGIFSGKGYIIMPNFEFVRLNVTFENIRINECFQHTEGVIKAVRKD